MKKVVIVSALAALATGPALAQNTTLEQVGKELAEIKAKNDRLEAEVEYLKDAAKAQRKDSAKEAVDIEALKTTTGKFVWSGDFRYRNEQIQTAPNSITPEHWQGRDRIRLRLGVTVKVNDTVTGRFQIATGGQASNGGATGDPRSTNQTLGEGWTRKAVGIDLAYVDWKALNTLNVQLGKMPQPWTRTASYFWDGDITPEGAALKFVRGSLFANAFYDWLNERNNTTSAHLRQDSKLVGGQLGWKQPMGTATFTLAAGYFDVTHVKDEQVSANPTPTVATCNRYNSTFYANSTQGNTTYASPNCTYLLSDFKVANGLMQLDFLVGRFPMAVFADYMTNLDAEVNPVAKSKLDTAYAAGVTFNRTGNPKSWDLGVMYQMSEADAVFGQFHDSDFGGGRTDTNGFAVKAGFVPAANWIINGTLFINKLNNDLGTVTAATGASTIDLDYTRLQLDLNFRF